MSEGRVLRLEVTKESSLHVKLFGEDQRWHAEAVNGPWYDDSNPEAYGDTQQQAVDNLLGVLRGWRDLIDSFLASQKGSQ